VTDDLLLITALGITFNIFKKGPQKLATTVTKYIRKRKKY